MKGLATALWLVASIVAVNAAHADDGLPPDDVYGTPPPKSVKSWVRLSVLGDRNVPFPIIWISPQGFDRSGFERLVALSPGEYGYFSTFARSYTCSDAAPKIPQWGTLQITEHASRYGEATCVLPRISACSFLSAIMTIPEIEWTQPRLEPIRFLIRNIRCRS
jgi:hypothetical protein